MSLDNYIGNKSILGLFQFIVNRIPPHRFYYELFAGSAVISEKLPDTAIKYLFDLDVEVVRNLKVKFGLNSNYIISQADAISYLSYITNFRSTTDVFVYLDPPYLFSERKSGKSYYKCELSDSDHLRLLSVASTVNFNCMISHPKCDIYDDALKGWSCESFTVRYHNHTVLETVYYNYQKPSELQTYAFVGNDSWDRQRIKRKIDSLVLKLAALHPLERNAIVDRIINEFLH